MPKPWSESPLVVSLITIIVTLLTTQFAGFFERRRIRMAQEKSLLLALHAEIAAIRSMLRMPVNARIEAWREGRPIDATPLRYPHAIYEAHVENLGELPHSRHVRDLVNLHSFLAVMNETGRNFQQHTSPGPEADYYASILLYSFHLAVSTAIRMRNNFPQEAGGESIFAELDRFDRELIRGAMADLTARGAATFYIDEEALGEASATPTAAR